MIINDIIKSLSNEKEGLTEALLKTQVLLHMIGKKELNEFVKLELNGYLDITQIPQYRKVPAQVLANLCNAAFSFTSHPIPIEHLEKDMREYCESISFGQPISAIEEMAGKEGIQVNLPFSMFPSLKEGLDKSLVIQSAWLFTSSHNIKGIITQIRSRFLDFILEIKDTLGDIEDEKITKEKLGDIDAIDLYRKAMFGDNTTFGNNTNIVIGSNNHQSLIYSHITNNTDKLIESMTKLGIPIEEINSLEEAIREDTAAEGKASFKGQTGNWLIRFLSRVGDGFINTSIDAISTEFMKIFLSYMGIK